MHYGSTDPSVYITSLLCHMKVSGSQLCCVHSSYYMDMGQFVTKLCLAGGPPACSVQYVQLPFGNTFVRVETPEDHLAPRLTRTK